MQAGQPLHKLQRRRAKIADLAVDAADKLDQAVQFKRPAVQTRSFQEPSQTCGCEQKQYPCNFHISHLPFLHASAARAALPVQRPDGGPPPGPRSRRSRPAASSFAAWGRRAASSALRACSERTTGTPAPMPCSTASASASSPSSSNTITSGDRQRSACRIPSFFGVPSSTSTSGPRSFCGTPPNMEASSPRSSTTATLRPA